MSWLDQIHFNDAGLVPVVAQEASTGDLLMLAYANRAALEATLSSGQAHYWSRSRSRLWRKGETSGNVQGIVEIRVDCDGDAILYRVRQQGPACHTLEESCFHRAVVGDELARADPAGHILARVARVVDQRESDRPEGSYTTYLFEQGLDKILKKVGEETTEVVVAAKNADPDELAAETADLLFHVLVMLRERNLPVDRVWKELDERFGRPPRAPNSSKDRSLES
ncbi:MAG: bifunctional phosphoribosyl-AMP cyclohydrolase/phosphoribosyl-ATP diphosphatase HisIE [Gemmatimonadota bacterium]